MKRRHVGEDPEARAKREALNAKAVRSFLLTRPEGATWQAVVAGAGLSADDADDARDYLLARGFARVVGGDPKLRKSTGTWLASVPGREARRREQDFIEHTSRELLRENGGLNDE